MSHHVYGLTLHSNLPIPGLVNGSAFNAPDIVVCLGALPPDFAGLADAGGDLWYQSREIGQKGKPALTIRLLGGRSYFWLLYDDGCQFLVDEKGASVWASWPESSTLEDIGSYFLGPVLGFILGLRGVICLHASAVVLDGHAVALVGPAWAGKSTTAGAFARKGCVVVSEDLVPILPHGERFLVQPGYPRVNLWPAACEALLGTHHGLPQITPTWEKFYLDVGENGGFQQEPLPLGAVYLLGARSDQAQAPYLEPMAPREALLAMLGNTYTNRMPHQKLRAREVEVLGSLTGRIPVRRVVPHRDPARVWSLCQVIKEDARRLREN